MFEDLDGDGRLDLVVSSFDPTEPLAIYRNKGDGTFEERGAAGVADQLGGMFCVQTDYNNDGRPDLYIARGAWLPVADPSVAAPQRRRGSIHRRDPRGRAARPGQLEFGDLGRLRQRRPARPVRLLRAPTQPALSQQGRRHVRGGLGARACGAQRRGARFCKGATWIDYDNDDDPDLFLDFRYGDAALFRNDGDGTFADVTSSMAIDGPREGFSCWAWDYDNDGWLDIFATCYERSLADVVRGLIDLPHRRHSNRLFHNRGGRTSRM